MFSLIQPFVNLLLFRAGPQDMPASESVLKIALISCFVTDVLGAMSTLGLSLSMILSAGQIGLLAVFVFLLLKLNDKTDRWLQTLSAIFGALALINIASLPFIQNLSLVEDGKLIVTPKLMLVGVLQLWFFITMARILKDAIEIRMGRAVLLTFLIVNIVPVLLSILVGVIGIEPTTAQSIGSEPTLMQ